MLRLTLVALFFSSLAVTMTGCTNTVRGFGRDVDSQSIQNYNARTASDLD